MAEHDTIHCRDCREGVPLDVHHHRYHTPPWPMMSGMLPGVYPDGCPWPNQRTRPVGWKLPTKEDLYSNEHLYGMNDWGTTVDVIAVIVVVALLWFVFGMWPTR